MPSFYLPGHGYETGNVLRDPLLPSVSGGQFLKFAIAAGVLLWIFRRLGQGGK